MFDPETTSTCEHCDAEIDLSEDGWQETDTGDACSECVEDAAKADHVDEQSD